MSYVILRRRWCRIFVLNVRASCEGKSHDVKAGFYKELGHIFDQFPRYDMKNLSSDFKAKVVREDIFKPTIGNKCSHEIGNDNGVRAVDFATSNTLVVKRTMIPHRNNHKHTKTSPEEECTTRFITS
jgi:hypothetical protein